jgi:hypothetical protein
VEDHRVRISLHVKTDANSLQKVAGQSLQMFIVLFCASLGVVQEGS